MSGVLIELPRRLEWKEVNTWIGRVRGTPLCTVVYEKLDGDGFWWEARNGNSLVDAGDAATPETARKAAEEALEAGVAVIREIPSSK